MRWLAIRTGLALSLLNGVASAETGPQLIPSRDVDITYRVSKPNAPTFSRRVRWQASTQLEREDGPGNTIIMVDHKAREQTLLRPETQSFLRVELPRDSALDQEPTGSPTRKGQMRIAGLSCTEWEWTDRGDGKSHRLCVTEDGVLLRETVDGRTVLQAKSVHYRKTKTSTFAVPTNYKPSLAPTGTTE
jgi:hypothetical protein